jgi:hypothetical protein
MAGKSLKTLADQVWKNHGVTLIPTFDNSVEAGTVLGRLDWNNINVIGHLSNTSAGGALPEVQGPKSCMLADFKRSHELNVGAAVSLLRAPAKIGAKLQRVTDVAVSFDSPVTYTMDLLRLEDVVEQQPGSFWATALGQRLRTDNKTRVVYQVIRGRISFLFRGSGGVGVDLQADKLSDLGNVGLSAGWKWRNEATLESKHEVVLAVDYAWYDWKKRRFREDKR